MIRAFAWVKTWAHDLGPKIHYNHMANQLIMLSIGKFYYHIPLTWLEVGLCIVVGNLVEHAFIYFKERKLSYFSVTGMVTALATSVFLRATDFWVLPLATAIGVAHKHLLRIGGRHLHNPSNFGILAVMLLFPAETFLDPDSWGNETWFITLLFGLGTFIMWRARLLWSPYAFLGAYGVAQYIFFNRAPLNILYEVTSPSLVIFAFFIVNDVRVAPRKTYPVIIYSITAGLLASLLRLYWGVKEVNLPLALFLASWTLPLIYSVEKRQLVVQRRVFFKFAAVTAVICAISYFSPYNRFRNLRASFTSSTFIQELSAGEPLISFGKAQTSTSPLNVDWGTEDPELYLKSWTSPRVVSRPLRAQNESPQRKFERRHSGIESYAPVLSEKEIGQDYFSYASISSGDINRDGYLDLAIAKINQPVVLFLNDGTGHFQDVSRAAFEDIPYDVEHLGLADLNNDGYLDLLVVYSQFKGPRSGQIFLFNPKQKTFKAHSLQFGYGKRSSGGIGFTDLNHDGKLDFFISYGLNWQSPDPDYDLNADRAEFYISQGNTWQEAIADYFPEQLAKSGYAGMTAQFSDFDRDGTQDFLLVNDFYDPTFTLLGKRDRPFQLADPRMLIQHVKNGMSYMATDFDNDGQFELWENGIALKPRPVRSSWILTDAIEDTEGTNYNREMIQYIRSFGRGVLKCDGYKEPLVKLLCRNELTMAWAEQHSDSTLCQGLRNKNVQGDCIRRVKRQYREDIRDPSRIQFDPELFPKKQNANVMHKRGSSGYYSKVSLPDAATYTGWSWASFPFDINNDGLTDIFVTQGYMYEAHQSNRMLLNTTKPGGTIDFKEVSKEYGLTQTDDSRGTVIADFDLDGDGDIVTNSYFAEPKYFENLHSGQSIVVELRARKGNYYAYGAQLEAQLSKGSKQLREIRQGGIWGTIEPLVQHFGIPAGENMERLQVRWPSGTTSQYAHLKAGYRYVIYE